MIPMPSFTHDEPARYEDTKVPFNRGANRSSIHQMEFLGVTNASPQEIPPKFLNLLATLVGIIGKFPWYSTNVER